MTAGPQASAVITGPQASAPISLLVLFMLLTEKKLTEDTQGKKDLFSFKSEEEV